MITLKNITQTNNEAVIFNNFSLTIPRGISCIDSENSEKRDCLIDLVLGLKKPAEGSVFFNNALIPFTKHQDLLAYRQNFGSFTNKSVVLLNNLNAYENIILFGEYLHKRPQKELYKRAMYYAEQFKIDNALTKLPYEMTLDEKRKTYFIMLLFKSPKIFIIDYDLSKLNLSTELISGIIKKEQELGCSFLLFENRDIRRHFSDINEYSL